MLVGLTQVREDAMREGEFIEFRGYVNYVKVPSQKFIAPLITAQICWPAPCCHRSQGLPARHLPLAQA
jgi:hypothetical protein